MISTRIVLALLLSMSASQAPFVASVRGSVFNSETGSPIAGVIVELKSIGGNIAEVYSADTSGDGTFQIAYVPRGQYRFTAKMAGYIPTEYGRHGSTGAGIPLTLAPGQLLEGVDIELTPSAALTGRVFDRDGDPLGGAVVDAMVSIYRDGKRAFQILQSTYSNDLGEFRVFGLRPGEYYLSATPAGNRGLVPPSLLSDPVFLNTAILMNDFILAARIASGKGGQVSTFYPGTSDARTASPIGVAAGATVSGLNFSVQPVPLHHLRGVVNGTGVQITLVPMNPSPDLPVSPRDSGGGGNGSFDFPDVIPGDYMLIAKSVDKEAKLRLDVRDTDINNVDIELRAGVVIPTHVTIEERTRVENNSDFRFLRFNRVPDPKIDGTRGPIYSTLPDGTVNFDVIPGEAYRIALAAVADAPPDFQNLYIKSIRMGNRDVLNDGLQFNGEADGKLEIVIGSNPGTLSGSVTNRRQRPSANTAVVLVPDVSRSRSDSYKVVTTDVSGQFRMPLVPPGNYKVFAWDDVDDGAWQDPEFIRRYEDLGTPVHIEESGKETIALHVIPMR